MRVKFFLRNSLVILVLLSLVGASVVNSTVIKIGKDSSGVTWIGSSGMVNGSITTSENKVYDLTTSGFQDAVWALNNSGGTVFLPPCELTITSSIEIAGNNITIVGKGQSTKITLGAGVDDDIIETKNVGTTVYSRILIKDLWLYGNAHLNNDGDTNGIHASLYNSKIQNVYISNVSDNGIFIEGGGTSNDDNYIMDCMIVQAWDDGIKCHSGTSTPNWNIVNNVIGDIGDCGIRLRGNTQSVIGNQIYGYNNNASAAAGVLLDRCPRSIVTGNRIHVDTANGKGIYVVASTGVDVTSVLIEGNRIKGDDANSSIALYANGNQINNTMICDNNCNVYQTDYCFYSDTNGGGVFENVTVQGNGFYYTKVDNSETNVSSGIYLYDNWMQNGTDMLLPTSNVSSLANTGHVWFDKTVDRLYVKSGSSWRYFETSNNVTGSGNMIDQGLNTTDSPTFADITLSSYPNLDKNSSDDFNLSKICNSNNKTWAASWGNIQLAVDDLGGNGTVWIPDGTFTASSTLWVNHSHVTIQGIGGTSWGEKGATIINPSVELSNGIIRVQDSTGFSIFDIKFNEGSRPSHTTHALYFSSSHAVTIDRCGFHYINGSSIYLYSTCYSVDIRNCDFQECGGYYGVNTFADIIIRGDATGVITDVNIEDCVFEPCYSYSIEDIDDSYASNPIDITGNYFEMTNAVPGVFALKGDFKYTNIQGNYFQGTNQHCDAIYINPDNAAYTHIVDNHFVNWDDTLDILGTYVTVENNFIKDSGDDAIAHIYPYGIVKGNTIIDSGGKGIYCSANVKVECNLIKVTGDVGITVQNDDDIIDNTIVSVTGDGIYGSSTNNVTISGNNISHCTSEGVYLESADSHVSNNDISHVNGLGAIYMATGSHRSKVCDNYIHNCDGTFAVFVLSSKDLSIQNNHLIQNDSTPAYALRLGGEVTRDLFITNNVFDGWSSNIITAYNGCTVVNQTILNNFGYNYNSIFPLYEQTTTPTLLDNTTAFWYDTDDDYFYSVANIYGDHFYVNWTTDI